MWENYIALSLRKMANNMDRTRTKFGTIRNNSKFILAGLNDVAERLADSSLILTEVVKIAGQISLKDETDNILLVTKSLGHDFDIYDDIKLKIRTKPHEVAQNRTKILRELNRISTNIDKLMEDLAQYPKERIEMNARQTILALIKRVRQVKKDIVVTVGQLSKL
jgi:hypothetical protein